MDYQGKGQVLIIVLYVCRVSICANDGRMTGILIIFFEIYQDQQLSANDRSTNEFGDMDYSLDDSFFPSS